MPRLFVALDLPEERRAPLVDLQTDALSARWTPPEQYHLTLRFIGDVPERQADAVEQALAPVSGAPFDLRGPGLGVFPSRRKPRVLFADIQRVEALMTLQRRIDEALLRAGVDRADKPFHPHITVARLKRARPQAVRRYLRERQDFHLAPFPVTAFVLYQSDLTPDGAIHTPRASFALDAER
ncbi:MAG: RNA 2',3'-cyclic phosphodiesterase [Bacteroidetes bacterium]|jgi:2'-5' RNA ligase|nr:RNA 2',3'-cyclic phosphodiesterase [Bacteroidota bacterium]